MGTICEGDLVGYPFFSLAKQSLLKGYGIVDDLPIYLNP